MGRQVNAKTGKLAMHYRCAACQKLYVASDVQVDHILPVVDPKKGFVSWDDFINRIFCEIESLQVMCKPCHKIKTDQEKLERKKK